MRPFSSILILFLLFLSSCSDEQKVPKGILPPPKMQAIMWDLIRAGEYQANYVFLKDTSADKLSLSLALYDTIYRIHDVTKDEFKKSYEYYRTHSILMRGILDSLSKKDPQEEIRHQQAPVTTPSPVTDTVAPVNRLQPGNKAGLRVADSLKKIMLKEDN